MTFVSMYLIVTIIFLLSVPRKGAWTDTRDSMIACVFWPVLLVLLCVCLWQQRSEKKERK